MSFIEKHQRSLYYLLSFLIPVIIIASVLASQNIYWGSKTTILASDGFHQYVIFAQTLRNILHGSGSLFYTFTSGLGLNFYALISYYLGSFLSPLTYFFDLGSMADAIYLLTLIKIGLICLSTYVSLSKLFTRIHSNFRLILSASYALMSFSLSQIEINMWLDVFILMPLIILGIHQLIENQHRTLYYLTLTILFIQNYYFGFMTAIFVALYGLVQLNRLSTVKLALKRYLDFIVVSLLATLSASIMLIPTYLDLATHGEKFTSFTTLFTDNSWWLDLFAKNLVGSYDTTKFGAVPTIYVGILPLLLALSFFTISKLSKGLRISYSLLLLFLIASFYLQPLDLLWQGMHTPNMFLHRYSWVWSTLIIFLAAESFEHLENINWKVFLGLGGFLGIGFIAVALNQKHYDYISISLIAISLSFLIAYLVLFISHQQKQFPKYLFLAFTVFFTLLELSLNTYYQISALGEEWVFPSREGYNRQLNDIDKLVKYSKTKENTFYRTEQLHSQTGNDSMKFNYNGISQFSSIRNRLSSSTLDRLGFKSVGTNLNLRYQNNTLITDSLFAVKYNLDTEPITKFGFTLQTSSRTTYLYRNRFASQLAILTPTTFKNATFDRNTLDNQTRLLNQLSGLHESYFSRLPASIQSGQRVFNNQLTLAKDASGVTNISFAVTTTTDSQVYVSVPNLSFSNDNSDTVTISVNGNSKTYTTDNAYSFFDLGYFKKNQQLTVTMSFPDNNQVTFSSPNFYALDIESYQKAMTTINQRSVTAKNKSNRVNIQYISDKNTSLFLTIPYDKGWSAKLNGKKVTIRQAQKGFMAVDVPKGKGIVVLTFTPQGFYLGLILSITACVAYFFYNRSLRSYHSKSPIKP